MNLNMEQLLSVSDIPGATGQEIEVYKPLELIDVQSNPTERTKDLNEDYESVRRNMHYQQQMLLDMSKICLENAKNSESPRFVEVFSTLMGQFTTSNKELLKMHKDMKDITNEDVKTKEGSGNNTVNLFVGSPSDLMDQLGDAMEQKEKIKNEALDGN